MIAESWCSTLQNKDIYLFYDSGHFVISCLSKNY